MFVVKLVGVPGRQFWDCRSSPTLLSAFLPENFGRLVYRLMRTEFGFEKPGGGWLAKKLGVAVADEALQERLRAAGLFDELSRLRWGRHPYLPKTSFSPHGQAIGEGGPMGFQSRLVEIVRAQGRPELESALEESCVPCR